MSSSALNNWTSFRNPITDEITFVTVCPMCRAEKKITVYDLDAHKYACGAHMQDAFPQLSDDDREALISGYCTKCWDDLCGDFNGEDG